MLLHAGFLLFRKISNYTPPPLMFLQQEDLNYVLQEDGSKIIIN